VKALLTLLLGCAACQLGDPVVDETPEPPEVTGDGSVACGEPAPCEEPDTTLELAQTSLRPLAWPGCEPLGPLDDDRDCAAERFSDDAPMMLRDVSWESLNIVIEATAPIEIVLAGSRVSDVRFVLEGPVMLRFEDETEIESVQIWGGTSASRVVLENVVAIELTIGDDDEPFAGGLEARHSAFEEPSMNVASADFDGVAFVEGFLRTGSLRSRDGLFKGVVFDLGTAVFAPSHIDRAQFDSCDTLSFFSSDVLRVRIPSCSGGATRFYGGRVSRGSLDGAHIADGAKLDRIRFGRHEPTTLLTWATEITQSAFCDHADNVKLEPDQSMCSICSQTFAERALICELPRSDGGGRVPGTVQRNFCDAIDTADECPEPLPDRDRRHSVVRGAPR